MKQIIFFLLTIGVGIACSNLETSKKSIDISSKAFRDIVLIDTFENELELDTIDYFTQARFHPMYIGEEKDTFWMNYYSLQIENRTIAWDLYQNADIDKLQIFIDTSKIVGSVTNIPPRPNTNDKPAGERRGRYQSYPVFLKNISLDTLFVGDGEYIDLIVEAKDKSGKWRPIEKPFIYFCGTGLTRFYLPPNEIVLTSCKLYDGNYQTEMRLAFGNLYSEKPLIYSNEFTGRMNYRQFEQGENSF